MISHSCQWNKLWRRARGTGGEYYAQMWQAASSAHADAVLINSFNDWTSGSQIEPAASTEQRPGYATYEPADFFLTETAKHAAAFLKSKRDGMAARHDEL